MNEILETLKNFDVHTLVGVSIVFWYFTRNIRNEIKEEIKAIRTDNAAQTKRTDRLYEMFCEMQREIKDIRVDMQKEIKDLYVDWNKEKG
jgi:hypothetical protein